LRFILNFNFDLMGAFLARLQGHTASDNATPLPALKVTMVSFVMAANDISLVSIYPTLPFMVASFFPELPVEQLGRRAGILGSMFNFGQLFGSLVWGRLADRYGRRPIMLVGLLGTVLSMCLFAFAVSFEMACTARFLWGALNGNIGVGKTYLSEITDDSNQARAFAWLGVSGGIVRLVGPALGGFLAQPATKWPSVFSADGFFGQFQFVLSCALGFVVAIVALVLTWFFLEETLGVEPPPPPPTAPDDETTSAVDGDDEASVPGLFNATKSQRKRKQFGPFRLARARSNVRPVKAGWGVMKRRAPIIAVLLYTTIGLGTEILVEVWPLFLLLPVSQHGFDLTSQGIGLMLLCAAIPQMISQVILFPRFTRRFGNLAVFKASTAFVGLVAFLLPFLSPATGVSLMFGIVMAAIGWVLLSGTWMMSFVSSFMITNNSCFANERATLNGVGHAAVAVARIVGPLGGGFLFAWSVQDADRPWPIDYHFVFHIAGLIYICAVLLTLPLPKSIDQSLKTNTDAADETSSIPLVAVESASGADERTEETSTEVDAKQLGIELESENESAAA
jgi:MFS family permease